MVMTVLLRALRVHPALRLKGKKKKGVVWAVRKGQLLPEPQELLPTWQKKSTPRYPSPPSLSTEPKGGHGVSRWTGASHRKFKGF